MSERHIVRSALAMRRIAQRSARQASRAAERATIVSLVPLQVEMTQNALVLDEDHFTLSHAVRQYDAQYGLRVGDALLLTPVSGGDLLATNVIAAANSTSGAAKQHVSAGGQHIGDGAISASGSVTIDGQTYPVSVSGTAPGTALVGKVPFYDDEGDLVGHIPLI